MTQSNLYRRAFLATAGASALALGACASGGSISSGAAVDAKVDGTITDMYKKHPFSRELADRAYGLLVMPGVVKGGFILGGAYGEGALRLVGDGYRQTADYYSFASASVGYQAGLQKTAHALFFMTEAALAGFRNSANFEIGVDAEVTLLDSGFKAGLNTTVAQRPILALVLSQKGLLAGASLEGAKYSRILA